MSDKIKNGIQIWNSGGFGLGLWVHGQKWNGSFVFVLTIVFMQWTINLGRFPE